MTSARLRFAPSPTGPLHIGGARTAIYNWAAARAMGGTFLLRIEDTDRARSTDESLQIILEGLRWLGIDWDEGPEVGGDHGPYFQAQRLETYARYADRLRESGSAYPCYCTPEEVEEGRQARVSQGLSPMYDRRCRDLTDEQRAAHEANGRKPSLRFAMPDGAATLSDLSKGDIEIQLSELDDWVMVRPDGMPTYNFACVVDDLEMGITHVLRGDEHQMNGFKQLVLFGALDATPPQYAHIPLILGKNGKKLSKRDASTNLLDYRDQGYPPDALFNYISLLGWGFSGDRDIFSREEMVGAFKIEGIGKSGAKFDEDKLMAICGHYVREMPVEALTEAVRPFFGDAAFPVAAFETHPAWTRRLVACHQERINLFAELPEKLTYFAADDLTLDAAAEKNMRKHEDAPAWLAAYAAKLADTKLPPSYPADRQGADEEGSPFVTTEELEAQARALAEELGIKFGHLVHPIRAALTGTNKGPGLFDVVHLLGAEKCLARLRAHGEAR